MGRRGGGYSSYRGRRTFTDVLKVTAVVLGVLVLLLLAALWLLGRGREDPGDAPAQSDQSDFSQPDASQADPAPPDASGEGTGDSSQQEQPQTEEAMRALELPVSAVTDGTAAALLEQAGANALVLTMKDTEGRLAWSTGQEPAASLGLGAGAGINEQLRAWNQGEIYTAAVVCCFRDNSLPYHRNDLAMRAGYGNWRDELGLRWLNPASEGARDYLARLCGELAELGFDEIVLECPAFPTAGNVALMLTQGVDRAQAVSDFLARVRAAVEPYGTVISLRLDSGVLAGDSGLSVEELGQSRIWMEAGSGESDPAALLAQAGVTLGAEGLVEVVAAFDGRETAQALLS